MNDNTPVVIEQNEIIPAKSRQDEREDVFISLLGTGMTMKEAGIKAGYSESYSKTMICNKFKSQRFLEKIRNHYNGYAHVLLPKIIKAESKLVDIILEEPEKLSKHARTIDQIKRSTGLLEQDNQAKAPIIKIGQVKNLLLNAHNGSG